MRQSSFDSGGGVKQIWRYQVQYHRVLHRMSPLITSGYIWANGNNQLLVIGDASQDAIIELMILLCGIINNLSLLLLLVPI